MSIANQRTILIQRTTDKAQNDYFKISNANLRKAVKELSGKSFKLWIYLADNMNGYKKEMYSVDFCNWATLSDSSYRRAWKELEEKGYILQHKSNKNLYMFKETGNVKQEDFIKVVDKEVLDSMIKEFVSK